MLKSVMFQLHWFLGITAGLVLAIVGVTGGLLSFEHEMLEAMNPGVMTVKARPGVALMTPQQLIDATLATDPGRQVTGVTVETDPEMSARVTLAPASGQGRGETRYVDPYDGRALGQPQGEGFFRFVMQLHRWILMPGGNSSIGKQIVGASTIILVFLALSGLYLRWPRRFTNWRAWFRIDFRRSSRALYWSMHSVVGTFVLVAYLIMALTGLWWSYDWYRNGVSLALTGKPAQTQARGPGGPGAGAPETPPAPVSLDPVWTGFLSATGGVYAEASFMLPRTDGEPVQVRILTPDAQHDRAADMMKLDPATGAVISHDRFADKPLGEQIYGSMFPLHSGAYFGVTGTVLFMIASLIMPLFFITGWLLYLGRRASKRRDRERMALRAREVAAAE
jgi:sulfite reductase (NADPH) flavoprotein alpha-component